MHLRNYQTIDIARATRNAPANVDRYLTDFNRVNILFKQGMDISEIAYITTLPESIVS